LMVNSLLFFEILTVSIGKAFNNIHIQFVGVSNTYHMK